MGNIGGALVVWRAKAAVCATTFGMYTSSLGPLQLHRQVRVASRQLHSPTVGSGQTASPTTLIGRERLAGRLLGEQAPAEQVQARGTFTLRHRGLGERVTLRFSAQATLH